MIRNKTARPGGSERPAQLPGDPQVDRVIVAVLSASELLDVAAPAAMAARLQGNSLDMDDWFAAHEQARLTVARMDQVSTFLSGAPQPRRA